MAKISDEKIEGIWNAAHPDPSVLEELVKQYQGLRDGLMTRYGVMVYPLGSLKFTHAEFACSGELCVIHNPSEHTMVEFPLIVRFDKSALMERSCPHGVGHPDPDSLAYFNRILPPEDAKAMFVHGCDGCCKGAYIDLDEPDLVENLFAQADAQADQHGHVH